MKKASAIFYFYGMIIIGLPTNSFGMTEETQVIQGHNTTTSKFSFVPVEKGSIADSILGTRTRPKNGEATYDEKLAAIHGKNLSSFPLSEETYKFIIDRVGVDNIRPFIFKAGPQIMFDDKTNLLK